ncbi:DNA-3-methyladenine glycosylase I [Glaciecola sp. XM2]|jgi:3-methyladenine DNA glycosylase Tag|uniref:DNA-3-methyladenine glycosylase I n=1 Tax=Glaciecola sp. XM2 TaxID=1914931 RepID=UPI001BDDDC74|nr:DNA-3-methyladenine glycosylase I [Glaciecola sp. XM2]MBT1452209.1 DNA-3-methyladenine glycosylase I [Glaciecola sp. XM2]
MGLEHFDAIYQRAVERKGSVEMVESLLSTPLTHTQLLVITDDRFLAEFTKKVFQSGFVWRVVRQKWPDFEDVFWQFDIDKLLLMPDEMVEKKATDPKIIRNLSKVRTIRENALMIKEVSNEHGSFAAFVANWDPQNVVGLWDELKQRGTRLGGNTGPYALRFLGVDTFLLSRDIEAYFTQYKIISGSCRSKRSLRAIQDAFNTWRKQSGRSLTEISQILAYSSGDNYVGLQVS